MKNRIGAALVGMFAVWSFSQSNVWHWLTPPQVDINSNGHALVYEPDSDRFIASMGQHVNGTGPYNVQMFSKRIGHWINHLPAAELYGVWADSTGNAKTAGITQGSMLGFITRSYNSVTYCLPTLSNGEPHSKAFYSYAYNTDDKKTYFYLDRKTFTYDSRTRLWDTLITNTEPTSGLNTYSGHGLYWQSLCFDAFNHEIILFGGGGVTSDSGHVGMWVLSPAAKTWTKGAVSPLPSPRGYSPMVYDPVNKKIVLFGGDHLDYLTNDTWVYDCATKTWSQKNPAISPSPRAGHALLYMPKSHDIVLVNGYQYSDSSSFGIRYIPVAEVWRYDLLQDRWDLIKHMNATDTFPSKEVYKGNTRFLFGTYASMATDTGDNIYALGSGDNTGQYGVDYAGTFVLTYDGSAPDEAGTTQYGTAQGTIQKRSLEMDKDWYAAVPAPDTAAQEALLRAMVPGAWQSFTPPRAPRINRDWGTAAFDPRTGTILVWDGGHSAYNGNDVAHYSTKENRWTLSYSPELAMGLGFYFIPSGFSFNGNPFMQTHTWDMYDFDPLSRKMVFSYGNNTALYDPDTKTWSRIVNPTSVMFTEVKATAHGMVGITGNRGGYLLKANPFRWERLPVKKGAEFSDRGNDASGTTYDSRRDRLLLWHVPPNYSTRTVDVYSFADSTMTTLTLDSNEYSARFWYREGVYAPLFDKIFFMGGNQLITYDVGKNRWSSVLSTGTAPNLGGPYDGLSCFSTGMEYDSARNLLWVCNSNQMKIWAVRPDTAPGTAIERGGANVREFGLLTSPNPVNPSVHISILLPERSDIRLEIFDPAGRLVRTLASGGLDRGAYEFSWRTQGASGLFVVKLTAGARTLVRRIVAVK